LKYKTPDRLIAWIESYHLQEEKAKSPLHALEPHFALAVPDEFAVKTWKTRKTLPRRAACPKPSKPMADKVSAQSYPEATPMSCTCQTSLAQRPANLAALHQRLQEIAASTKASIPTTKERPVVVQGTVLMIRGK
jgi:hypothetical protein